MTPVDRDSLRALWRKRAEALARFDDWAERHPSRQSPEALFAAAAGLYELLPREARRVPIATDGVRELHRRLACLRPAR